MRFASIGLVIVLVVSLANGAAHAQAPQPESPSVDAALRLIPPDAHAAIVIPHLKHASDHLTRLLEGMDRAGLLIGSRPIDHFKSITGFATAVDDNGSAALVVMDSGAESQRLAWLVPVTDAEEFLAANFTAVADQPEARRSADGRIVYARALQTHVLLSSDSETIRAFDAKAAEQSTLPKDVSDARPPGAVDSDVIVIARAPLITGLRQRALKPAADMGLALPGAAVLAIKASEQIETLTLFVQFDPLALVVRGAVKFQETSAIGAAAVADAPADAGLARLPKQPAALSLSIHLAALGGTAALLEMAQQNNVNADMIPGWLPLCQSLQVRIAPSPAGAAGGMLNGATLTIAGDDPSAIRDVIKRDVLAQSDTELAVRQSKWTDDASLPDGATAAAFEIRSVNPPAEVAMLETLLFGASGLRGYVAAEKDTVIVTCAQRPALLSEARVAVEQASNASNAATGLAADAAVKVMRQWMPAQRDIEGYIGLGQLSEMKSQLAAAMPGLGEVVPAFDSSLPPVGFAFDVSPRRIDGTLIVPAGVVAQALDEVMRRRAAPMD